MTNRKDIFFREKYWKLWLGSNNYKASHLEKSLLNILIKYSENRNVLEVGVGDGSFFLKNIANQVSSFTGIDISTDIIEVAKSQFKSEKIKFMNLSTEEEMPFSKKEFDLIYCFRTSWYLGDLKLFSSKFSDYLSSDGVLLIEIMNSLSFKNIFYMLKGNFGAWYHKDRVWSAETTSPFTLARYLKEIGYKEIQVLNLYKSARKTPSRTTYYNVFLPRKVLVIARKGTALEKRRT